MNTATDHKQFPTIEEKARAILANHAISYDPATKIFTVRSGNAPGKKYEVSYKKGGAVLACNCLAGQQGRRCCHLAAATAFMADRGRTRSDRRPDPAPAPARAPFRERELRAFHWAAQADFKAVASLSHGHLCLLVKSLVGEIAALQRRVATIEESKA